MSSLYVSSDFFIIIMYACMNELHCHPYLLISHHWLLKIVLRSLYIKTWGDFFFFVFLELGLYSWRRGVIICCSGYHFSCMCVWVRDTDTADTTCMEKYKWGFPISIVSIHVRQETLSISTNQKLFFPSFFVVVVGIAY